MKKALGNVGIALAVLLWLGTSIDTTESMPENAVVYIVDKEYVGMPTMMDMLADNPQIKYTKLKAKEAKAKGYTPNKKSANNDDFYGESHSLTYSLFQNVGILPSRSRWNKDGSWNW